MPLPDHTAATLAASAGSGLPATVEGLTRSWQHATEPADSETLSEIKQLIGERTPPGSATVLASAADVRLLLECPLSARSANCLRRGLARQRFADGEPVTVSGLLGLRGLGAVSLAEVLCVAEAAARSGFLPEPVSQPEPAAGAAGVLWRLWQQLTGKQQEIVQRRMMNDPPDTLKGISRSCGVTTEAVRARQQRLRRRIDDAMAEAGLSGWASDAAAAVRAAAGPVCSQHSLDAAVADVCAADADSTHQGVRLARGLVREMAGYRRSGDVVVAAGIDEHAERVGTAASGLADNAGLVDEAALRGRFGAVAGADWDAVLQRSGLRRLNGVLSVSGSRVARTKAALISIGRPATRDEIARLSGVPAGRVGSCLSGLDDTARADKSRWAITGWLDERYGGIPSEIARCIERDGGRISLKALMSELPARFGVTANSVRAYAQTAKFQRSGGFISLADPCAVKLRPLDGVVSGVTFDGLRYWTFRAATRHLRGYSLSGVPPEIAAALGCEPDSSIRVPVSEPEGFDAVSLRWQLVSTTGASVGRITGPLQRLAVSPGDEVLLVLDNAGGVALRPGSPAPTAAPDNVLSIHEPDS